MAMQLSCIPQPPVVLPPTDIELMKTGLEKINKLMREINEDTVTGDINNELINAIKSLNELILSLDNSNDFHKIGGFEVLMPLLLCVDSEVIAATSELVADLCQNNAYCQARILDFNLLPEFVKMLDNSNEKIRSKALYAISCLCRHNKDAINHLSVTGIIPSLMKVLLESDERLRAKAAFFLSYLSTFENFRELFYQADVVKVLAKLLKEQQNSSSEHLLSALLAQVSKHKQSRIQSRQAEYGLKEALLEKMELYGSKEEYQEAKEYCSKILNMCFHDEIK